MILSRTKAGLSGSKCNGFMSCPDCLSGPICCLSLATPCKAAMLSKSFSFWSPCFYMYYYFGLHWNVSAHPPSPLSPPLGSFWALLALSVTTHTSVSFLFFHTSISVLFCWNYLFPCRISMSPWEPLLPWNYSLLTFVVSTPTTAPDVESMFSEQVAETEQMDEMNVYNTTKLYSKSLAHMLLGNSQQNG